MGEKLLGEKLNRALKEFVMKLLRPCLVREKKVFG
jgi:hypothetical protein